MREKPGIIIPLDGSRAATAALGAAQAMADVMEAVLYILHVADLKLPGDELAKKLGIESLRSGNYILRQVRGDVADTLVKEASPPHMKMIVMSSHGVTFDSQRLMGHIAMEVIQRSPDPVMIIRPDMKSLPDPQWRPKRMLVPLNGSPTAAAAMDRVLDLAAMMGCGVDVVHIAMLGVEPPTEAGSLVTPGYLDYPHHEWGAWVEEFITRFARRPDSVELRLFHREGVPPEEMLKLAQEAEEELITLSWQGHLEKDRARTIKEIIRHTEVPVLLIRT